MIKTNSDTNDRWQLVSLNTKAMSFIVYDNLMKKEREFFVPFLYDVRIEGYIAFVSIRKGKVMALNLNTANRSFIK
jgi:hypothetical protein